MDVAIVKYNAGNIYSVVNAMKRLGINPTLTDDAEMLQKADRVLFPGQGQAKEAMEYLKAHQLDQVIKNLTQPVLGICLPGGEQGMAFRIIGTAFLILFGLFAGMFVGCLAFAIAEMLNSIPIFARRIGFRHGLGVAICFAALGKLTGSLLYFAYGIFQTGM